MTIEQRVGVLNATVGRNVPATSPTSYTVSLGDVMLDKIDIRIPPGHNGTTGLRIVFNGSYIVPWSQGGDWLIMNDEALEVLVGTEVDTHLTLQLYNTDVYSHTAYLRFFYTPMTLVNAGNTPLQIVSVA